MVIIQVKNDGDQDQNDEDGRGKKWSDSKHKDGCGERKGVKDDFVDFGLSQWKDGAAIIDQGRE